MLKKSITFTNLNDETVTEEHHFHLTKAELVEMQMGHNDTYEKDGEVLSGYQAKLQRIIDSEDGAEIMREFKDLILNSYGRKSDDGKRFVKSQDLRDEFASSEAYSALFMELCTDAGAAATFINGVMPKDLADEVAKIQDKPMTGAALEAPRGVRGDGERNVFEGQGGKPATTPPPGQPRVLTMEEATGMPSQELHNLLATGQAVLASNEG